MHSGPMHIGKVAKLTGASPKAIRHYEQLGLLNAVPRSGAYRIYTDEDVQLIVLIKQAQALGFKLSELRGLKDLNQTLDWTKILELINEKRKVIAAEVTRLQQQDAHLESLYREVWSCLETESTKNLDSHPASCDFSVSPAKPA